MSGLAWSFDNTIDEMREIVRLLMSANIRNEEKSSEELCVSLNRLQCPFTWKPYNDCNFRDFVGNMEDKLTQAEQEEGEWTAWTRFVYNLILCYEHGKSPTVKFALEKQEECEKIADKIASDCASRVKGAGLKHVALACKVFLLIKSNLVEEAVEILNCITDIEDMAKRDQASVWSARGAVLLEYGLKGMKESVSFIEKALELDADCAEWHFLLGKSLSRIRRIEDKSAIPADKELECFETAVKMSNDIFYMVLLAQTYMDTARHVAWHRREWKDWKYICDEMNQKSVDMYRKAMENSKENAFVLARCSFGFIKLPFPLQDMKSAETCLFKSLEIDDKNIFTNHVAGLFYKMKNNFDKAKYYFNRSAEGGNFTACMEMLEIKQKECTSYNLVPDLESYMSKFREKPYQESLLGLLGAYHYFVKNDFNTALNVWLQIIQSDIDSKILKEYRWSCLPHKCNISKTILTEIIRMLDGNTCSEEERMKYENVLNMYRKHNMGLVKHVEGQKYQQEQGGMQTAGYVGHGMWRNARTQRGGEYSHSHESRSTWRRNK